MKLLSVGFDLTSEKFLSKLKEYRIDLEELDRNIKYLILNQVKSAKYDSKDIILTFNKDEGMKALLSDIESFNLRIVDQHKNLTSSLTNSWKVTTLYYYYFFIATLILRFFFLGNTFFSGEDSKKMNDIVDSFIENSKFFEGGNYTYKVNIDENDFVVRLVHSGKKGTHETTWNLVNTSVLKDIRKEALKNSEEKALLKKIDTIFKGDKIPYLSQVRNLINYRPKFGYLSLSGEIKIDDKNYTHEELYKEIMNKDLISDDLDLESFYLYGTYLSLVYKRLYSKYLGLQKDALFFNIKSKEWIFENFYE